MNTTTTILPSHYHSHLKLDRANVLGPDSWLSKSAVYELYQSSLYKWRYFPRQYSTTPAMTWGSMVDTILTCPPEEFNDQFIINPYDSLRTKAAKEWKADQDALHKTVVTQDLINEAYKAAEVVTSKHHYAASLVRRSASQVLLMNRIMHPSGHEIGMKGLVDFAPEGEDFLVDLKTTRDFSASGFAKTIAHFGYHIQAAHYLGLWNLQNPDDQRRGFKIIWQDSASPYEVAVTSMPESDIADGADIFNHLVGKIIRAAEKDEWPMKFTQPILLGRAAFGTYADEEEIEGPTITQ
mgnify:CR=1 FL=1